MVAGVTILRLLGKGKRKALNKWRYATAILILLGWMLFWIFER